MFILPTMGTNHVVFYNHQPHSHVATHGHSCIVFAGGKHKRTRACAPAVTLACAPGSTAVGFLSGVLVTGILALRNRNAAPDSPGTNLLAPVPA